MGIREVALEMAIKTYGDAGHYRVVEAAVAYESFLSGHAAGARDPYGGSHSCSGSTLSAETTLPLSRTSSRDQPYSLELGLASNLTERRVDNSPNDAIVTVLRCAEAERFMEHDEVIKANVTLQRSNGEDARSTGADLRMPCKPGDHPLGIGAEFRFQLEGDGYDSFDAGAYYEVTFRRLPDPKPSENSG